MNKDEMREHMAKIRAMRGKGRKKGKGSRKARLTSEVKALRKEVGQLGKLAAKQHKILERAFGKKKRKTVAKKKAAPRRKRRSR